MDDLLTNFDGVGPVEILDLSLVIAHILFDTEDDTDGNKDVVDDATDGNAVADDDEFDVDDVDTDANAESEGGGVTFNDVDVSGERGVTIIGEYVVSVVCERGTVSDSERVG
jgi:hypothetical protein